MIKGIIATLAVAAISAGVALAWNWIAAANEDHARQAPVEDLARSNYAVVEQLRKIHESEDAKRDQIRELCLARQLLDRAKCAEAGVELPQ